MCTGSYNAGKARNEEDGSRTRAVSPPETCPRPNHAQHPGVEWRARFRRREHLPFQTRLEAVDEDERRPETGHSIIAMGPSSMRVPSGIRSRSRPAVVMFSPRSPAATLKPASGAMQRVGRDEVDLPEIG